MKKSLFTLVILAATFSKLLAGPVDATKAQRIGEKFMKTTSLAQKTDIQSQLVYTYGSRDAAELYVFNIKGGGFVVVSAEDAVKPILAYSTTGSFLASDIADGFDFTMRGYQEEIQYVREHKIAATADITAEWKSIEETGYIRQNRNAKTVDILLATTWNQNWPYNSQCPEDAEGSGGRVYAGCVATAMGQVINYYKHPARGTGSHTYSPGGYPTQTANFGETDYHFELMPNDLDSLSTDEEVFYIAQLLHHLGISVNMQYSGSGSGAYSFDVPNALENYFGFTGGELEDKDWWGWQQYTNEEWAAMLKEELDQMRPMYYSGSDDNGLGGHAYVCDGYDENDYFHFNWGWSGRDDAFCAIGALNTTKYAFNQSNSALFGCYPQTPSFNTRPAAIDDMVLTENDSFDGVILTWTNPATDNQGNALTSLDTIVIRRNFETIATFASPEIGAAMTYTDLVPVSRIYEYSIIAKNASGMSIPVYEKILIGEKCELVFELHDEGGDGWKGASISVTNENGFRIGIITLKAGSEETRTVPLLRGNLNFIWNHGWYHTSEQYDTDFECSYTIKDLDGNVLYTSAEHTDGVFMTYENNCQTALQCFMPENLASEYTWNTAEEFGVTLSWEKPNQSTYLDHFSIYRQRAIDKTFELIAEIGASEEATYTYFDNLTEACGDYSYQVTSTYIDGEEQCESDPAETQVEVTNIAENELNAQIYPNPTSGMLNVVGQGTMQISVSNLLGQQLQRVSAENQAVIDMSQYQSGCYIIRIESTQGVKIEKVNVSK